MTSAIPTRRPRRALVAANRALRMAFERLPPGARDEVKRRRAVLRGIGQVKRNQAMLALRVARLELAVGPTTSSAPAVTDQRFPEAITSRICTQAQLAEPWYATQCAALGEPFRAHRKLWEHAYIVHTLDSLDQLRPGRRGLGFGVGRESLVALFAGRGCEIVATDLPLNAEDARVWSNTDQHSGDIDGLLRPSLCDPDAFHSLVSWRPVDMRFVPDDLADFDFCWSACSLEHLGTLEAGMEFIERSVAALRPGGIAVHTTEFNLTSNDATVDVGHTVLYRRRDLEDMVRRMEGAGHQVAILNLEPGQGVLDEYVDLPPYVDEPHLRLWFGKFATTSVALVIRAGGDSNGQPATESFGSRPHEPA